MSAATYYKDVKNFLIESYGIPASNIEDGYFADGHPAYIFPHPQSGRPYKLKLQSNHNIKPWHYFVTIQNLRRQIGPPLYQDPEKEQRSLEEMTQEVKDKAEARGFNCVLPIISDPALPDPVSTNPTLPNAFAEITDPLGRPMTERCIGDGCVAIYHKTGRDSFFVIFTFPKLTRSAYTEKHFQIHYLGNYAWKLTPITDIINATGYAKLGSQGRMSFYCPHLPSDIPKVFGASPASFFSQDNHNELLVYVKQESLRKSVGYSSKKSDSDITPPYQYSSLLEAEDPLSKREDKNNQDAQNITNDDKSSPSFDPRWNADQKETFRKMRNALETLRQIEETTFYRVGRNVEGSLILRAPQIGAGRKGKS